MDRWYNNGQYMYQVSVSFTTPNKQSLFILNIVGVYICRTVIIHIYVSWPLLNFFRIRLYMCEFNTKFGWDILHTKHCLLQS